MTAVIPVFELDDLFPWQYFDLSTETPADMLLAGRRRKKSGRWGMRGEQESRRKEKKRIRSKDRRTSSRGILERWEQQTREPQKTGKRVKRTNARGSVFIWMSLSGQRRKDVIRKTNHLIHKTWASQRHIQRAKCSGTEFRSLVLTAWDNNV